MSVHNMCSIVKRGKDGDDRMPDAFIDECLDNRVTPSQNNTNNIASIVSEDGATLATTGLDRYSSANLNLMNPEDWLIKHHERSERTAHSLKPPVVRMKPGEPPDDPDDPALRHAAKCDKRSKNQQSSDDDQVNPANFVSGFTRTVQSSETRTSNSKSWPTVSRRNDVEHGVQEMLTADVEVIQTPSTTEDHSMPESQAGNSQIHRQSFAGSLVEDILLVQGEKTQEAKNRRALIHVTGAVFVAIVIVFGVVSGFSRKVQAGATAQNHRTPSSSPTISPILVSPPSQEFLNMTIEDGFASYAENEDPGNNLKVIPIADEFLDILRQTNRNMTVFGLSEGAVRHFMNDYLIVKMAIQPTYSGHTLHCFESLIIEDEALSLGDFYDGMVLKSRSGDQVNVIIKDGNFFFNGVPLHNVERNLHYANGYLHKLAEFPYTFVSWFGKSNYDILLQTNEERGGDLSRFIELIDASDLKIRMSREGLGPMTVFCFTNQALSEFENVPGQGHTFDYDETLGLIEASSDLHQILLNHVLEFNFVRKVWQRFPIGTKVSDTELRVLTLAGRVVDLVIEPDKPVIINGQSKIIQEDILSLQGVVHIIDKPLTLL